MKDMYLHTIHIILFISHEQHCSSRNLKYTEWSLVFTFFDKLLSTILSKKENIHHYRIREKVSISPGMKEKQFWYFSMD